MSRSDNPDGDPSQVVSLAGSLYKRVGGAQWFVDLVDRFYALVENDPVLRPLYPDDLSGPRERLSSFLAQRWGGPPEYTESRGHPRLRMRHFPFAIGLPERDAWLRNMTEALHSSGLGGADMDAMLGFFDTTATMVVNRQAPDGEQVATAEP